MTTHTEFMAGVHSWLVLVLGFNAQNVFESKQNGPDRGPGVPWATYKDIGGGGAIHPIEARYPVDPEGPTAGEQYTTKRVAAGTTDVSINIYAANGADLLKQLLMSRTERASRILLHDAGAALVSKGRNRELYLKSDTVWKPRYQADFTFNTWVERSEQDYIVDIADINGKIENDDVQIYVDRNG